MAAFLRTTLLIIATLVCAVKSVSQPIDAAICKEDTFPFINSYIEIFKADTLVTLDSVLQQRGNFRPMGEASVIFWGYDPYFYWYRFSVENKDSVDKELFFFMGQLGVRDAELFQNHQGTLKSLGHTGYSHPFESRPYLHSHYLYPIIIPANSVDTFYLRLDESHAYKTFAFALFHPRAMKKRENKFYFSFGIMVGLLLLFLIFNFYLFLNNREKIHFWYTIYIAAQIFLLLKHEGLDQEFFGLDSELGYRATSMASSGAIAIVLLMHVVQLFIGGISRDDYVFKAVSFVKWSLLTMTFVQWLVFLVEPSNLVEVFVVKTTNATTFVGLLTILIYSTYGIYKGFKPGWLILAGLGIFLFGGIERILFLTSDSYLLPPSLFEIGIVVETMVISFGLMYRYQRHEIEKNKIAAQLQKQKVVQVKRIISAQEEERKRIAEDLHDDLGSNLAVIKLNLQSLESDEGQKSSLMQLLDDTSAHVRQVSHNLMPPEFANTSLKDVIAAYVQQLNEDSRVSFAFYQKGGSKYFGKDEELMIYRIVMELTNNILKHAEATEATIQLFYHDESFEMVVEDNGKGFSDGSGNGIGLKSIQSRVQYLQGELAIDSNKAGTTIIVSIPLKSRQNDS
ncbi:MAG: 7TM diverse intracellular signaling domain-containing protein [Imperialibacter sp.]|uniref:sensor histidine kinase n=1 Tax=Imperialibacter sp. TaxID=2038411 RepID=UPI0032EB5172